MKIAVISDIHEDIVSLRLAMTKIEKNKCDEIVCLGDISGFVAPNYHYYNYRNAHECLAVIKANCHMIVLGNHDLNALKRIPENMAGFDYPGNWYELDYHEKKKISDGQVWLYEENELDPLYTKNDMEFLSTLPEYQILEVENRRILLSHYFYPNLTGSLKRFYTDTRDFKGHFEFMEGERCEFSMVGHVHAEGIYRIDNDSIICKGAKKSSLLHKETCIAAPAVTCKQNRNGFLIFDIKNLIIETIRI